MANLYGVANAPGLPQILTLTSGDIVCSPNVYTAVITSAPLIAPSTGYFYAMIWAMLEIQLGATIAFGLYGGAAIGAGSFTNTLPYSTAGMAANGFYWLPFCTFTTPSQNAWQGAGSTVSLGLNPQTNGATVKQYSTMTVALFRAPDQ